MIIRRAKVPHLKAVAVGGARATRVFGVFLADFCEAGRSCGGLDGDTEPGVEFTQGALALQAMAQGAVAHVVLQGRQKIKGDIGGLEVLRGGVGGVIDQRTHSGGTGRRRRFQTRSYSGSMHAGHEPGGDGFHVTLNSTNLSGEKDIGQ